MVIWNVGDTVVVAMAIWIDSSNRFMVFNGWPYEQGSYPKVSGLRICGERPCGTAIKISEQTHVE